MKFSNKPPKIEKYIYLDIVKFCVETTLGSLQLNDGEEQIYKKVLVSGQLSRAEILDTSSISGEELDTTLSSLVDKKLLRKIPGMIDRYACLLPLGSTKQELEAAAQDVAVLGREIDATAEQEVSNLQTQLDQVKNEIKSQVDEKLANLDQSINDLKTTVTDNKQTAEQGIEQTKTTSQTEMSTQFSQANEQVGQFADKFHSDASGRITSKKETIDRKISSAKSAQETIKGEAGADLQELDLNSIENSKTETIGTVSRVFSSSKEKMTGVKTSLDQTINSVKNQYLQHTDAISSAGQQFTDQNTRVFSEAKESLATQTSVQQAKFDELSQSFQESSSVITTSLQSGIEKQSNFEQQVNQSLSQVSSDLGSKVTELEGSLKSRTQEVQTEFSQYIDESTGKLASHQQSLETTLQQSLNEQTTQIKESLQQQVNQFMEATSAQLEQLTAQFASQLTETSGGIVQTRNTLKGDLSSSLGAKKEAMDQKLSGTLSSGITSVETIINQNKVALAEISSAYKEELTSSQQNLAQTITQLNQDLQSGKTSLEEWNSQLQQKIETHIQEQSQVFKQVLEMGINSIKQEIEGTSASLSSQSDELQSSLSEELTTAETETSQLIQSSIQQTIASITTLHQNMKQRFDTAVSRSRDEYNSLLDQNKSDMDELLTQLDQDAMVIKEDISASLSQQMQTIRQKFDTLLQSISSHTNELVQSIESSMNQQIAKSEEIGKQVISSVEELSSKTTGSQIDAVQRTFDTYGSKYKETTDIVSDRVTALASILDSVFKMQEETETPTLKTTHVVGKSAIVKYVNEMIGRVKSKITILVPDVSMIFDSKILEMGMTSQITIVSKIDEIDHKDWIEKMHGAKANVTLRTLTDQGFGAKLPDFIGAEREGEEIIIGTLDEGAKDYVAVASNSEDFVKIFGSQIISEYSRGRSKQLQK